MLKSYQSVYVTTHRWMFKNFGQGDLPRFKSLFNVSFLLIILLTNFLLIVQFIIHSRLFAVNTGTFMAFIAVAVFFMLMNYLVLLNNRWLKRLNERMNVLSRHNPNTWGRLVLVNVIMICVFLIFTIG
jgi:hypothetical protein